LSLKGQEPQNFAVLVWKEENEKKGENYSLIKMYSAIGSLLNFELGKSRFKLSYIEFTGYLQFRQVKIYRNYFCG